MTINDDWASMTPDELQRHNKRLWAGKTVLAVVEERGEWVVHVHMASGSVFPPTSYPTKRKAIARLMQLMGVGPLAPQAEPERIEVGTSEGQ